MTKTVEQMTKVEKGIPWPEMVYKNYMQNAKNRGRGRPHKRGLPFAQLEVGDSFLFPSTYTRRKASYRAAASGFKFNRHFMVGLDDNQMLRCWRVQ